MHIAAGQAGRGAPGWSRTPPGPREGRWPLAFVLLGAVLTACVSVPEGPGSAPDARDRAFSAPAAWHHLQALTQIGTRQTGPRGSARARKYLRQRLEDLGANVEELTLRTLSEDDEASEATHLLATLPGESSDRFLLAASYDTRALPGIEFVGANASASGPALVLELARVLSQRPRAYTVVVALVDGDLLPAIRPGGRFPGSRSFASWLADGGTAASRRSGSRSSSSRWRTSTFRSRGTFAPTRSTGSFFGRRPGRWGAGSTSRETPTSSRSTLATWSSSTGVFCAPS